MGAEIRKATSEDITILVELMEEFYAEAGYTLSRSWAAESFSRFLSESSYGCAWLLFHDATPAGYVVLTVRFAMEYGGIDAFIDDLFVRPAYRRVGLANLALSTLFAECERRGVLAVHVEVGQNNTAANALYAKFGLRPPADGRHLLTALMGTRLDEV